MKSSYFPIGISGAWGAYLLSGAVPQAGTFALMVHGFADTALNGAEADMTMLAWPTWSPAPPSGPLRAGIDPRRVAWVDRAKGAPIYTPEVIGAALRLNPTGTPFDPSTYQGHIMSGHLIGHEQAKFVVRLAQGNIDGGNLYMQRNGDTERIWCASLACARLSIQRRSRWRTCRKCALTLTGR